MVTDKGGSVAGLTVQFGGVLAKYNLTATVQANGTYSTTEVLGDLTGGTATAQTRDAAGTASNVAMTLIDSRNVAAERLQLLRWRNGGYDRYGRRRIPLLRRRQDGCRLPR